MTITIKKTDTKEQIDKKLSRLTISHNKKKPAGFNAKKYSGKGIFGEIDGLQYQKQVRDGWGR